MKTTLQNPRATELRSALAGLVMEQRALAKETVAPDDVKSNATYAHVATDLALKEQAAGRTVGVTTPTGQVTQEVADKYLDAVADFRNVVGDPLLADLVRDAGGKGAVPDDTLRSIVALMGREIGPAEVRVLAALRPRISDAVVPTYVNALKEAKADDAQSVQHAKVVVGTASALPVVAAGTGLLPLILNLSTLVGTGGASAIIMSGGILGRSVADYATRTQQASRAAFGVNRLGDVDVKHELGRLRDQVKDWKLPPDVKEKEVLKNDVALIKTVLERREGASLSGSVDGKDAHAALRDLAKAAEKALASPSDAAWKDLGKQRGALLSTFSAEQLRATPALPRSEPTMIATPEALAQAHVLVALGMENPAAMRALNACGAKAKGGKLDNADIELLKLTFGNELSVREYLGLHMLQDLGALDIKQHWPDAARFGEAKNLTEAIANLDKELGLSTRESAASGLRAGGSVAVLSVALTMLAIGIPIVGASAVLIGGLLGSGFAASKLAKSVEKAYVTSGVEALTRPGGAVSEQEALLQRLTAQPPPWLNTPDMKASLKSEAALVRATLTSAVMADPTGQNGALVALNGQLLDCAQKLDDAADLGGSARTMQAAAARAVDGVMNPSTGEALLLLAAQDEFRDLRNPAMTELYTQVLAFTETLEPKGGKRDEAAVKAAATALIDLAGEMAKNDGTKKAYKNGFSSKWLDLARFEAKLDGAPKKRPELLQEGATTLRTQVLRDYDNAGGVNDDKATDAASRLVQLLWHRAHAGLGLTHPDHDIELNLFAERADAPKAPSTTLEDPQRAAFDVTGTVDLARRWFNIFGADNNASAIDVKVGGDAKPDLNAGAKLELGTAVLGSIAGEVAVARLKRERGISAEVNNVRVVDTKVKKEVLDRFGLDSQPFAFNVETSQGTSTVFVTAEGFPIPAGA